MKRNDTLKEVSLQKIKKQLVEAAEDHLLDLELPEILKKQLKEEMYDCWGGAWYLSEAHRTMSYNNKDKSHIWKVKYFDEREDQKYYSILN